MRTDNTISLIGRVRGQANKLIYRELHDRGHKGLAPSHGNVLAVLLSKGEMTKTEISNAIGRDRSTVTVLLKKLEKNGYITTRVNDEDSRSAIVYLTEKGEAFREGFTEISEKIYDVQFRGMTEEQITQFKSCLEILYTNFKSINE